MSTEDRNAIIQGQLNELAGSLVDAKKEPFRLAHESSQLFERIREELQRVVDLYLGPRDIEDSDYGPYIDDAHGR